MKYKGREPLPLHKIILRLVVFPLAIVGLSLTFIAVAIGWGWDTAKRDYNPLDL